MVIRGKRYKTPRYYDKLVQRLRGEEFFEVIKSIREAGAKKRAQDSTPKRLAVREQVQQAKVSLLKRDLS